MSVDQTSEERERAWQDLIVDHSQFPRHHGAIASASHQAEGENPLCGDRVHIFLNLGNDGNIELAKFEATGCAISLASASILTDAVQGQSPDEALRMFEQARNMLTTGKAEPGTGGSDLEALRLVSRFPMRVKCASLCWHVLREAIVGVGETVTTESS